MNLGCHILNLETNRKKVLRCLRQWLVEHICQVCPTAHASLFLWYAIALCFLFNADTGNVESVVTASFLLKTIVGSSIAGSPNIRSLYRMSSTYQSTGALSTKNKIPFWVQMSRRYLHGRYQQSSSLTPHLCEAPVCPLESVPLLLCRNLASCISCWIWICRCYECYCGSKAFLWFLLPKHKNMEHLLLMSFPG